MCKETRNNGRIQERVWTENDTGKWCTTYSYQARNARSLLPLPISAPALKPNVQSSLAKSITFFISPRLSSPLLSLLILLTCREVRSCATQPLRFASVGRCLFRRLGNNLISSAVVIVAISTGVLPFWFDQILFSRWRCCQDVVHSCFHCGVWAYSSSNGPREERLRLR